MPLLRFTKKGIYCEVADVYIDPWRPVRKALITHGHADHARAGHKHYLCHRLTAPIILARIDPALHVQVVEFNEPVLINGVKFTFHPAGHIVGSAQIRAEYKGEVWVVSGDYKTEVDGLATPIEVVPCHTFITECTFGLPVYDWKPQEEVFAGINQWWRENAANNRPSLLYGYSLGKAQRLIQGLDASIGPILTHGAVENMNRVIRQAGVGLQATEQVTAETDLKTAQQAVIVAPPGAFDSSWSKKFKNASHASASGWMTLRGARRRRGADRGFVLSDHVDWKGLNEVVFATGAENVIATHGYTATFVQWLKEKGLNAMTETTDFVGENLEGSGEEAA